MKNVTRAAVLLLAVIAFSGCYHAKVTTGLTPSAVVLDKPFAVGWLYGLIPPPPIDGAAVCPSGVAMVETELSFVNQLVSAITFGIFAPMHIKVTCATGSGASLDVDADRTVTVGHDRTEADIVAALDQAATMAVEDEAPAFVRFE